jgi:hypothetical protein
MVALGCDQAMDGAAVQVAFAANTKTPYELDRQRASTSARVAMKNATET